MPLKDPILELAKSEVGDDKDNIIAFLCQLVKSMTDGVSAGFIRASVDPDTRKPKPPPDSI